MPESELKQAGQLVGLELIVKTLLTYQVAARVKDDESLARAATEITHMREGLLANMSAIKASGGAKATDPRVDLMWNAVRACVERCFDQPKAELERAVAALAANSEPQLPTPPPNFGDGLMIEPQPGNRLKAVLVRGGAARDAVTVSPQEAGDMVANLMVGAVTLHQQEPTASKIEQEETRRTVTPTAIVLANSSVPGHKALVLKLGGMTLAFNIPDEAMQPLGNAFIKAGAETETAPGAGGAT
jgi:hypothetical protein